MDLELKIAACKRSVRPKRDRIPYRERLPEKDEIDMAPSLRWDDAGYPVVYDVVGGGASDARLSSHSPADNVVDLWGKHRSCGVEHKYNIGPAIV